MKPQPQTMKLGNAEPALAILVVDGKARYANERLWRQVDETVEAYADRVRARIVELLTCPGRT